MLWLFVILVCMWVNRFMNLDEIYYNGFDILLSWLEYLLLFVVRRLQYFVDLACTTVSWTKGLKSLLQGTKLPLKYFQIKLWVLARKYYLWWFVETALHFNFNVYKIQAKPSNFNHNRVVTAHCLIQSCFDPSISSTTTITNWLQWKQLKISILAVKWNSHCS